MRRLGSFRPEKALGEGRPEARTHLYSCSGGCVFCARAGTLLCTPVPGGVLPRSSEAVGILRPSSA